MTEIQLTSIIKAPIETCFDLSLSADVHQESAAHTNERAIAGRTTGIFELNDEVTWEAKHFGVKQQLTVKIVALNRPYFFADRMLKGAFKSMYHEHHFEEKNGITLMKDIFSYEVPFGIFGVLFDRLILKTYMTRFLITRNETIKKLAEKRG